MDDLNTRVEDIASEAPSGPDIYSPLDAITRETFHRAFESEMVDLLARMKHTDAARYQALTDSWRRQRFPAQRDLHKQVEARRMFAVGRSRERRREKALQPDPSRPLITLHSQDLPQNLDAVEAAMIKANSPIYQMKGALMQIIRIDQQQLADGIRRQSGALVMNRLGPHMLIEIMMGAADFLRITRDGPQRCAPPLSFASHYLARGSWKLRVLQGIIEAPTLRPDGSVLANPGYDPQTGIYLDTGGVVFPAISDCPSREEALEALNELKDIIKDFPFVPDDEGDAAGAPSAARSVALSALLTGVARKALRTAPAHAVDASTMATGKTLFCDVVAMLATGRSAPAVSLGHSNEELNKRLFSVLLQGDPVVVIDNIEREVESDELCTVLTAPEWQNRILGESQVRTVPTNVLFLPNGNNLQFKGDITTRVIVCRMDARMENPGTRSFDRDLRTYVPEHRPRLVAAALTVLRAFVVAGRPGLDKIEPFARFEDWSNLVRGALIWLGEPDPVATREAIVAIDPARENLAGLISAWRNVIGVGNWVTAKEVLDARIGDENDFDLDGKRAELSEAISAIFPRYGVTNRSMGRYLVGCDGRIVDGFCIRKHTTSGHSTKFALLHER